ncbi:MAG: DUF2380 domain-containing protein [Woeseia sp.]
MQSGFPRLLAAIVAVFLALCAFPSFADTRIAVLEFELNDLTPMPRTPAELERTASIAPTLRDALSQKSGYELTVIDAEAQADADASFGYLFDRPELAAELGKQFGTDWVAVGRLHKPSFLFAYLKVHLVNVETGRVAGDYVVEIKGAGEKVVRRGAKSLAEQIDETIRGASETR